MIVSLSLIEDEPFEEEFYGKILSCENDLIPLIIELTLKFESNYKKYFKLYENIYFYFRYFATHLLVLMANSPATEVRASQFIK